MSGAGSAPASGIGPSFAVAMIILQNDILRLELLGSAPFSVVAIAPLCKILIALFRNERPTPYINNSIRKGSLPKENLGPAAILATVTNFHCFC